jgi:signal transduction histidine kinase
VTVADNGAGLDSNNLEDIFNPFYTTKQDGMGMGLAISRSIVESHGGELWASANVPRGTKFQFTMPLSHD